MLCVVLGLTFAAPRHTAHVTHQTNERRAVDARIAFGRSLLATTRPADHCVVLLKLCHALKLAARVLVPRARHSPMCRADAIHVLTRASAPEGGRRAARRAREMASSPSTRRPLATAWPASSRRECFDRDS